MAKTKNFCFKLDEDIRDEIIQICEDQDTTLAEVLRSIVQNIIEGKQELDVPPRPPERRITLKDK